MGAPRYHIGIDLGTTHTVVAYTDIAAAGTSLPELLPIPQLVAPGEVAEKNLLPSFRYHPVAGELAAQDLVLPWERETLAGEIEQPVIGEWARELGSRVEGRLVYSAKSWLSHPLVDRGSPILPWAGAEGVERVSPVLASASYLLHVRQSWNRAHPKDLMEHQEVAVTIPASFDEVARRLTVEAADMAGLHSVLLLEEPLAACYDWHMRHAEDAARILDGTRLLLVCDVGGGTTDLSLISVQIIDGRLRLNRIGVGDHLMLGGDNIDLALAYLAEQRIVQSRDRLGAGAFSQLVQQTRQAKEVLLAQDPPDRAKVTVLGSGSRLVAGARSCELSREEVSDLVLDGFFPWVGLDERPADRRGAIVEFGLPYAADPAISRHVAAFLDRHAAVSRKALGIPEGDSQPLVPDSVLFNGGVFSSSTVKERVHQLLGKWAGSPLTELSNDHPHLAVARGAVSYLAARKGTGMRIGGGLARGFFLQVEGVGGKPQGVCILPRGADEGVETRLEDRRFSLRLGQPVQFNLYSAGSGRATRAGELVKLDDSDFVALPPLAAALKTSGDQASQVEVVLAATLTPVGTLQLECVDPVDERQRWNVEFQIRRELAQQRREDSSRIASLPVQFETARELLQTVFGPRRKGVDPNAVKRLRKALEQVLGRQDLWEVPVLRALCDELIEYGGNRRRSVHHERVWLSLTGLGLRPGFGYPLDEWRLRQIWPLFDQGLQHTGDAQAWSAWWIFWRRVAGGLDEVQQQRIFEKIEGDISSAGARGRKPTVDVRSKSIDDMLRLAASLEQLPVSVKVRLAKWLVTGLKRSGGSPTGWWALGRVAARELLHGSAHTVIPADTVSRWLPLLLAEDWRRNQDAAFAAVMVARMTGDRGRDVSDSDRCRVVEKLRLARAPERWRLMVSEVQVLDELETQRFFGEKLPAGLRLVD